MVADNLTGLRIPYSKRYHAKALRPRYRVKGLDDVETVACLGEPGGERFRGKSELRTVRRNLMNRLQKRPSNPTGIVHQIESLTPAAPWEPAHELVRTAREVTLSVDLPGVLPKNLHVACRDDRLFVWGHRTASYHPRALEHTTTRVTGDFALDVPIPDGVDPNRVFRTFEAGILTVVFPRRRDSLHRRASPVADGS